MPKNLPKIVKSKPWATLSTAQKIYLVVQHIPHGKVSTYGSIAQTIGIHARTVGYALNQSHTLTPPIPAHRVLNHKGILTGHLHFSPSSPMHTQLQAEGHTIYNHTLQNFKLHYWDANQNFNPPKI